MKPSREDVAHREQSVKKTAARRGSDGGGSRSALTFVSVVLVLVVAIGGGGGWYLWQQVQQVTAKLDSSNDALSDSESALGTLKVELEDRQRSSSKTEGEVSADINLIRSEIRKLWDVSNKRNKKAIKINKDKIASLGVGVKKQKTQLGKQGKAAAALTLNVAQLQDELDSRVKKQSALQGEILVLTDQIASLQVENEMLKSMAVEQEKLLQTFKSGQYQQQMVDLEQAVNAIDAHRRQVNSRLDQLDKELGALYKKP